MSTQQISMEQAISNFISGISTFFIGMVVVFGMLFLLIGMMMLLGKVVNALNIKMQATSAKPKEIVEMPIVAAPAPSKQDELELIAVITAAIAASLGTTSDKLQVRSLRKVQRKSL